MCVCVSLSSPLLWYLKDTYTYVWKFLRLLCASYPVVNTRLSLSLSLSVCLSVQVKRLSLHESEEERI